MSSANYERGKLLFVSTPRELGKSYIQKMYEAFTDIEVTSYHPYEIIYEDSYTLSYAPELGDFRKIAFLKKELKNKHLNAGLRVQYAKELQRLER